MLACFLFSSTAIYCVSRIRPAISTLSSFFTNTKAGLTEKLRLRGVKQNKVLGIARALRALK